MWIPHIRRGFLLGTRRYRVQIQRVGLHESSFDREQEGFEVFALILDRNNRLRPEPF